MTAPPVADDEIVLRHIPGGPSWQVPPDGRIASPNFRLRTGETGISVSRLALAGASQLMSRLGNPSTGSRIASAPVGELRKMGYDVVAVPLDDDPGHAEIRPATANAASKQVQRALAALFQFVD